jgi:hypothetical protein
MSSGIATAIALIAHPSPWIAGPVKILQAIPNWTMATGQTRPFRQTGNAIGRVRGASAFEYSGFCQASALFLAILGRPLAILTCGNNIASLSFPFSLQLRWSQFFDSPSILYIPFNFNSL